MNTLILLSCLMQWGATKQEAQQEIQQIFRNDPTLQLKELTGDMLAYDKMYIKEPIKLKRL